MGIPEHWLNYFYQFGIGGLFFVAGLMLIVKTGACNLKVKADRTWFTALILGFVFLASLYAVWIYVSVATPSVAEGRVGSASAEGYHAPPSVTTISSQRGTTT